MFEALADVEKQRRLQYYNTYHPDTAAEVAVRVVGVLRHPIIVFVTNDKNETNVQPQMSQADFDALLGQFIDGEDLQQIKSTPGNLRVMTPDEVVQEQHISAGSESMFFARGFIPWLRNHTKK